jgi:hypothetical protein
MKPPGLVRVIAMVTLLLASAASAVLSWATAVPNLAPN